MRGKLSLLIGLGAGYVLGTRSGRERYDQMAGKAKQLWQDPRVQEKAAQAQHTAQDKVAEKAGHAAHAAKDKVSSSGGQKPKVGDAHASGAASPTSPGASSDPVPSPPPTPAPRTTSATPSPDAPKPGAGGNRPSGGPGGTLP